MKLTHQILISAAWLLAVPAQSLTAAPVEQTVLTQNFCYSVAISGDTVVAGAWVANGLAGVAYVYTRSGTTWTQQAVLTASQPGGGDRFGESVAISGDLIIIGAPGEQSNATHVYGNAADNSLGNAGAAYIFKRSGTTWTQQAYLKAHNTREGSRFGSSVSISGTTAVVGSGISKTDWSGTSALTDPAGESSNAKGINGNGNDTSAPVSGAAYVYEFTDSNWRFDAYLKASNTEADDSFGYAVATDGELIVVGAPGEGSAATGVNGNQADNSVFNAGAAYVFARGPGRQWAQQAVINPSGADALAGAGSSVGIDGGTFVVGTGINMWGSHGENRTWIYTGAGMPNIALEQPSGSTLTIGVKKSANLATTPFADLPMTGAGTSTIINGAGKLEFEFPVSDNAAFFRLQSQ